MNDYVLESRNFKMMIIKTSKYNTLHTSNCRLDRKMANVYRLFINQLKYLAEVIKLWLN